ncbi:hypothetical protein E2C01_015092 [Portunus trituberculatus]|uniref:Uncharacterized protein n=1 Tax=Portunus trituberculatus TaxID=210409 RepID=A0A5B7DM82_PORTR|nr:hypothetical protein [Portunus trituberculatus]
MQESLATDDHIQTDKHPAEPRLTHAPQSSARQDPAPVGMIFRGKAMGGFIPRCSGAYYKAKYSTHMSVFPQPGRSAVYGTVKLIRGYVLPEGGEGAPQEVLWLDVKRPLCRLRRPPGSAAPSLNY